MTDQYYKKDVCEKLRIFLETCDIKHDPCIFQVYQWYIYKCDHYETKEKSETKEKYEILDQYQQNQLNFKS